MRMKTWLIAGLALVFVQPAQAQLMPHNEAGVTFGHVHLTVADPKVHYQMWVEQFGGVVSIIGIEGSLTVDHTESRGKAHGCAASVAAQTLRAITIVIGEIEIQLRIFFNQYETIGPYDAVVDRSQFCARKSAEKPQNCPASDPPPVPGINVDFGLYIGHISDGCYGHW